MTFHRTLFAGIAAAAVLAFAAAIPAHAQTLDKIKKRGVLVVGSKADYKPFGFRDPSGAIVGFEPDMAKDVADKLGVKLELEPVVSSNRMQFLQQGKIDLMIATMNDTPERRKVVGIVEPIYYASGVNVIVEQEGRAEEAGSSSRARRSAASRAPGTTSPSPRNTAPRSSPSRARPKRESRCCRAIASAGSMTTPPSPSVLADPKWAGFEMSLPTIMEEPWGLAVQLDESDGPWGKFMARHAGELAPQRPADRAREEVEHPAVAVSWRKCTRSSQVARNPSDARADAPCGAPGRAFA